MENMLIHIGYHKTATTWFQTELFTAASTVFAPVSRRRSYQSTLATDFFQGRDGYLLSPFNDNREAIRAELREFELESDAVAGKIPVISHERLSGNPHASGFDAAIIARRLAGIFPKARVFIVIREQTQAIISSYFQFLKGGGTRSLESYLNTGYDGKLPGFSPHHFDYQALIAEYMRLFGTDRVQVLPYEMFVNDPGAFFERLGEFVGHSFDLHSLPLDRRAHERERVYLAYRSRWFNRFLTCSSLNGYSSASSPLMSAVVRAGRGMLARILPGSLDETMRQRLEGEIAQWVGDRYVAGNQHLSQTTGLNLGVYGYRL
jgi:sulfotransferase family protein